MEVLISADRIGRRVRELGIQMNEDYRGKTVHLVCVLKGAFTFLADLARTLEVETTMDFLAVSSYDKAKTSSGEVQLTKDLDSRLEGKDVLIVEDIADTGLTLRYLYNVLKSRRPASLRVAAFLDKPSRRKVEVPLDYIGFEIPNRFVVGYGLDYDQKHRHLPYVAALDDEN
jgi:hypoxanthine phosphoribosyltransferase